MSKDKKKKPDRLMQFNSMQEALDKAEKRADLLAARNHRLAGALREALEFISECGEAGDVGPAWHEANEILRDCEE